MLRFRYGKGSLLYRDQVLAGTKIVLQQEKPKGYVSVPI
ncbi:hypothetical protein DmGdi_21800 [Gluconobacter sp. Gdi]|nr:hypothetical protein DmGdi_21800 [Gluconobacter sp. Gdi]